MGTVAIIPAGGSGTRMGSATPKQFLLLGGIPILVHTLRVFQEVSAVDEIFLVLPLEDVGNTGLAIVEEYRLAKVTRILAGGKHRQDSVKRGIDALDAQCEVVVIHDGVRPFVSLELVEQTLREVAGGAAAVTVGVPVKDTVKAVISDGFVGRTLKRDKLWLTQTPQTFAAPVIKEAYRRACADNYYGTDDAVLVERMGIKVKMLPGSFDNIKITTENDLEWAEFLLRMRSKRSGCNINDKMPDMVGSGK